MTVSMPTVWTVLKSGHFMIVNCLIFAEATALNDSFDANCLNCAEKWSLYDSQLSDFPKKLAKSDSLQ